MLIILDEYILHEGNIIINVLGPFGPYKSLLEETISSLNTATTVLLACFSIIYVIAFMK
jgi:hypothetical protein